MNSLRRAAKKGYRQYLIARAQGELQRMAVSGDNSARLTADALRETFAGSLSSDERAWVDKIEALRRRLDVSQEPITIINYGAGNSDENRTEAEMAQGTVHNVTVSSVSKISKYEIWVLMLFKLIRKFKPEISLELGTAVGISASYQAAALKLNGHGTVVTLEGAPTLAELSAQHIRGLGLTNFEIVTGRFQDTLQSVLENHPPIGFAFIDGHHDGKATLDYFDQIYPYLADEAVLVFDDIYYYASMRAAWNTLEEDARVKVSVDLSRMGVCVVNKSGGQKAVYKIPMI